MKKNCDLSFIRDVCLSHGETRLYKRGEFFQHAGEPLRLVGWVIAGSFKHSLIDSDGNAKAVGFVFNETILANYFCIISGEAMETDIIAMENSEVSVVPVSLIRDRLLSDKDRNLSFVNALFKQAYKHVLNNSRYTSEERYNMLLQSSPRLFKLASLGEIASYLNISRRQLHRFRLMTLKN